MPRYVAILEHSANTCPTSNKAVRAEVEKLPSKMPAALQKHNVKILSDNILSPSHKLVLVLEAPNTESVRDLLEEIGMVQWNETVVYPSYTLEEALKREDVRLPTLF